MQIVIETLMAWLPSLLISLIAVGAFLYLAYHSRAQIDQQRRTLQDNADQLIEQFLQRESRMTRHRLQIPSKADNTTDPARWLAHLRRCWLDAELAALVDRGRRHSDYDLLQNAAMPLLRLTQRNDNKTKPASKPRWSSAESKEYLQKTRDTVSSQKKVIEEFKTRKTPPSDPSSNTPASAHEAAQAAARNSNFISNLGSVDNNSTTLLEIIEKLERELAAAQSKYDAVSEKLSAIEARKSAAPGKTDYLTISTEVNKNPQADNTELLSEMESAYSNSIVEMKKMGDINRQQRQLIFQMEKELALLRKDTSEYQVSSEMLEKLKLQLRDYENCTTILEMESETLREQIQNLRKTIAKSDPSEELSAAIAAHEQPPADPAEASTVAETSVIALIEAIAAAESLERAGAQLIVWLGNQAISAVVYIKGRSEQIWVSSEGRVDDHSKQLLKSMMPTPGQPISEVREGIMFIYPVCRILLYGKGDFHEKGSKAQLALRDTFSAADHLLQMRQDQLELRHFHQQIATVQKKLHSLAVQHTYIDAEHLRTGESFRKELDEYLLTAETTEIQRHCIDTMLEDFDSQLEILSKTGKLIASGLKVSIQDLAKIAEAG